MAVAGGLVLAFAVYLGLLGGDCLPRDGSAATRACDAAKERDFWLYPVTVLAVLALSVWLHARGSRWGIALALGGGMVAGIVLTEAGRLGSALNWIE